MDVYSWAQNVDTTSTDDATGKQNLYTEIFQGTSSASPVIVGAAAIIQGMWLATHGEKMGPLQMREILASHGTPSANPAEDRIGVQPDLRVILDTLFPA